MTVELSLVLVASQRRRDLSAALRSLSAPYQQHLEPDQWELIVVDTGDGPLLLGDAAASSARVRTLPRPGASLSVATRAALEIALGEAVGLMADGARLATPGLLRFATAGARLHETAVVVAPVWRLGWSSGQAPMRRDGATGAGTERADEELPTGYGLADEAALLENLDWPADGYRLFGAGAPTGTSLDGWFYSGSDGHAFFLRRDTWSELEEMLVDDVDGSPSASSPVASQDLLRKALELPGARSVMLLGEATFVLLDDAEDRSMEPTARARPSPGPRPIYLGTLPRAALADLAHAAVDPVRGLPRPLGPTFDRATWRIGAYKPSSDPQALQLVEIAQREVRESRFPAALAVCALALHRFPDDPELRRLDALAGAWHGPATLTIGSQVAVHLALGDAAIVLGETDSAVREFRQALALSPNPPRAHLALASLAMPGDGYRQYLEHFHALLRPATYLEIGVAEGTTIALARPPTVAIGVDPAAVLSFPLATETHLYSEGSDDFFRADRLRPFLHGAPLPMAFVDGLHHFEQALRDIMNIEPYCSPESVVLVHDTVPLDEITQRRERETDFWSGDVWKVVLSLRRYRPDLRIFTIATPPTGLTVITNFDPSSTRLRAAYDEIVALHIGLGYDAIADDVDGALSVTARTWQEVLQQLGVGAAQPTGVPPATGGPPPT